MNDAPGTPIATSEGGVGSGVDLNDLGDALNKGGLNFGVGVAL